MNLVELKRDLPPHRKGETVSATPAQLKAAGLTPGDYVLLGTYPSPTESTLQIASETTQQDKATDGGSTRKTR